MDGWNCNLGWRTKRARGAGPVQPPDLANLKVWLDGDDIDGSGNSTLTNGSTFGTWANKGSLGGTMGQATAGNQPTYRATGGPGSKAVAEFDGADWLASSLAASDFSFMNDGSSFSIYSVARTTLSNPADLQIFCATSIGSTSQRGMLFGPEDSNPSRNDSARIIVSKGTPPFTADLSATNGSAVSGVWNVVDMLMDPTNVYAYCNGAASGSIAKGAVGPGAPAFTLVVGATPTGTFGLNGRLGLLLVFSAAHDATTQAAVWAYISAKYGTSFPTP